MNLSFKINNPNNIIIIIISKQLLAIVTLQLYLVAHVEVQTLVKMKPIDLFTI